MKINFIGAGNLAEAIVYSMIKNTDTQNIGIFDNNKEQYKRYEGQNIHFADSLSEALSGDMIFLLVKPDNFPELLRDIKDLNQNLNNKIFVSAAAGVSTEYIQNKIGQKTAIVRVMPNTPVFLGKGMTAICRNENVNDADFDFVCGIFKSMGEIIVLREEFMNDIIAVNGSSPAYFYLFAKSMLDGAAELGFDKTEIYPVVLQSLAGSLAMLIDSGKTPDELIRAVASPGGTTEAALKSFYSDDFTGVIKKAMKACAARADEISANNK